MKIKSDQCHLAEAHMLAQCIGNRKHMGLFVISVQENQDLLYEDLLPVEKRWRIPDVTIVYCAIRLNTYYIYYIHHTHPCKIRLWEKCNKNNRKVLSINGNYHLTRTPNQLGFDLDILNCVFLTFFDVQDGVSANIKKKKNPKCTIFFYYNV